MKNISITKAIQRIAKFAVIAAIGFPALFMTGCPPDVPPDVDEKNPENNLELIIFSSANWDDNQQKSSHEDIVTLLPNSYKFLHCIVKEKNDPRTAARVPMDPNIRYRWYKNGTLMGNGELADTIGNRQIKR